MRATQANTLIYNFSFFYLVWALRYLFPTTPWNRYKRYRIDCKGIFAVSKHSTPSTETLHATEALHW